MKGICCYFDESGAKGRADVGEQFSGESGTAVGILIPRETEQGFYQELDGMLTPFKKDGKLHIAALTSAEQEALRELVFDWIRRNDISCFYDSQYVAGFQSAGAKQKDACESFRKISSPRYSPGGNPAGYDLLHRELFEGVALKALYFAKNRYGQEICVDYLTDHVDESILKIFRSTLQDAVQTLSAPSEPHTITRTYFDKQTHEVKQGSISSTVSEMPAHWQITAEQVGGVDMANKDSPFVVIADVVANSLNHHLTKIQVDNPGINLNSFSAVKEHPLGDLFQGMPQSDEPNGIDAVYRYPKDEGGSSEKHDID